VEEPVEKPKLMLKKGVSVGVKEDRLKSGTVSRDGSVGPAPLDSQTLRYLSYVGFSDCLSLNISVIEP
jgi:hypothetical protein